MSLRVRELEQVAAELSHCLGGAVVQKVHCPTGRRCYLEVRRPGQSLLLLVCTEADSARVSVVEARPPSPAEGTPFQRRLRTELNGAKLSRVVAHGREVLLTLERRAGGALERRVLFAELGGRGDLVLLDEEGRVLATGEAQFRVPRAPGERRVAPQGSDDSRLVPVAGHPLPLAAAAEALLGPKERTRFAQEARRQRIAPVKARLSRLERTLAKVRAESERMPQAEEHRRLGELLSQNLQRLPRGASRATLLEYREDGPKEVEVKLDPSRTPKDAAERHFHQYRRLMKGCEVARARLAQLQAEREELAAELERLCSSEDPSEPGGAAHGGPLLVRGPGTKPEGAQAHRPYKEYLSWNGHKVLVGRGGADNDLLTFRVARPHDIWLHALGVSGAHVLVPLTKGAVLAPELLLDAAHLALHHSNLKGEPRGEVSYTQAKYVKRVKGGAPGQVTYTREKTFMLRLEPARLARLLATSA